MGWLVYAASVDPLYSELETRIRVLDRSGVVQLDTIWEDEGARLAEDALAGATAADTGPIFQPYPNAAQTNLYRCPLALPL
jgi:hypothetical protein